MFNGLMQLIQRGAAQRGQSPLQGSVWGGTRTYGPRLHNTRHKLEPSPHKRHRALGRDSSERMPISYLKTLYYY